ncbi:MAG: membrane dipeptidase [Algoriphagus sp.]|nr:membrane dipeptidase [Algoriphagus sp.]
MINRKEFLKLMGSLAGVAFIPDLGFASSKRPISVDGLFDLHCHPAAFFRKGTETYTGDEAFRKSIDSMNSTKVQGAFLSIVSDLPVLKINEGGKITSRKFNEGEAWGEYKRQLSILKELIADSEAKLSTSPEELKTVGNVKLFLSCEGADFIEGNLDRINLAYDDGVRSIQLVHYAPNDVGDLQTSDPINSGLSSYGKQIVQRMNELGMVIDLAHATFKTCQDVAEITGSPIMVSHSILQERTFRPVSARAISVKHAELIAETGGIIGAWPSGFSRDMEDFTYNTLRLIDTIGIDHVGLGTDMDANYLPVIADYFDVEKWTDSLSEKGLSGEEIQKLVGGNAKRVLSQVLK